MKNIKENSYRDLIISIIGIVVCTFIYYKLNMNEMSIMFQALLGFFEGVSICGGIFAVYKIWKKQKKD